MRNGKVLNVTEVIDQNSWFGQPDMTGKGDPDQGCCHPLNSVRFGLSPESFLVHDDRFASKLKPG